MKDIRYVMRSATGLVRKNNEDGAHDVMDNDALRKAVEDGALEAAADGLEQAVLAKGAPDNYSFVLIGV